MLNALDPRRREPRSLTDTINSTKWGVTPWTIDFVPDRVPMPAHVDVAIVGGGFSGLSAAANVKRLDPTKQVALFEAESIGARSSGHTGGLALAESAAGDLPGLGDVLVGLSEILQALQIECDLALPGVYELDRTTQNPSSPVLWRDTGDLRVGKEVPGGSIDPGKMVAGLAKAASTRGVLIFDHCRIGHVDFTKPLVLHANGTPVSAGKIIFATNSESL